MNILCHSLLDRTTLYSIFFILFISSSSVYTGVKVTVTLCTLEDASKMIIMNLISLPIMMVGFNGFMKHHIFSISNSVSYSGTNKLSFCNKSIDANTKLSDKVYQIKNTSRSFVIWFKVSCCGGIWVLCNNNGVWRFFWYICNVGARTLMQILRFQIKFIKWWTLQKHWRIVTFWSCCFRYHLPLLISCICYETKCILWFNYQYLLE